MPILLSWGFRGCHQACTLSSPRPPQRWKVYRSLPEPIVPFSSPWSYRSQLWVVLIAAWWFWLEKWSIVQLGTLPTANEWNYSNSNTSKARWHSSLPGCHPTKQWLYCRVGSPTVRWRSCWMMGVWKSRRVAGYPFSTTTCSGIGVWPSRPRWDAHLSLTLRQVTCKTVSAPFYIY